MEKLRLDFKRTKKSLLPSLTLVSKSVDPRRQCRRGGVVFLSNENDDALLLPKERRTRVETRGGSAIMDDMILSVGNRVALKPSVSLSRLSLVGGQMMLRATLILLAILGQVHGVEPSEDPAALVAQLGAARYAERESAARLSSGSAVPARGLAERA